MTRTANGEEVVTSAHFHDKARTLLRLYTRVMSVTTQDIIVQARKLPQYVAASIAVLSSTSTGSTLGWSAPALPYLESLGLSENGTIPSWDNASPEGYSSQLSAEESSFICSLLPLGALVGSLPAGLLCEKLGRRATLQIANFLLLFGWILLCSVERNVIVLFVARFVHGLGLGIDSVAVPLYNEEIAEVEVRGAIGVFYDFSIALGILWVYVFGSIVPYFWLNLSCGVITIAAIIGLLFVPETPVYLLKLSHVEKAEKSLKWFRGVNDTLKYDIRKELQVLQSIVDSAMQRSEKSAGQKISFKIRNFGCKYLRTTTAKSFYIIMFLMILRQFGGINPITFYTVHIFQESRSSISPYLSTAISGVIEMCFVFVAFAAVDRLGRRILLLISSSAMAISLFGLATYFYLKTQNYELHHVSWLPIMFICFYFAMFSIGLGPIPWFMMAEIVPTESKGWVTGVCSMTNWLCTFVSVQVFLTMVRDIGSEWTYMFYCLVNVIGFILIIFVIPETKNKSIETIHEELSSMRIICK